LLIAILRVSKVRPIYEGKLPRVAALNVWVAGKLEIDQGTELQSSEEGREIYIVEIALRDGAASARKSWHDYC
jgi:hypothetical protein